MSDVLEECRMDLTLVLDSMSADTPVLIGSPEHQILLKILINITFETGVVGSWPSIKRDTDAQT